MKSKARKQLFDNVKTPKRLITDMLKEQGMCGHDIARVFQLMKLVQRAEFDKGLKYGMEIPTSCIVHEDESEVIVCFHQNTEREH